MTASHACSICNTDKHRLVNSLLSAGRSPNWIEGEMRRLGQPTKGETIRRHYRQCLNGDATTALVNERKAAGANGRALMQDGDFAAAVRAKAQEKLEEGSLNIRTEHGLQAQALIDRRVEKAQDRGMMLRLAELLSGARIEIEPPDELVLIEGEWSEVESKVEVPLALTTDG